MSTLVRPEALSVHMFSETNIRLMWWLGAAELVVSRVPALRVLLFAETVQLVLAADQPVSASCICLRTKLWHQWDAVQHSITRIPTLHLFTHLLIA